MSERRIVKYGVVGVGVAALGIYFAGSGNHNHAPAQARTIQPRVIGGVAFSGYKIPEQHVPDILVHGEAKQSGYIPIALNPIKAYSDLLRGKDGKVTQKSPVDIQLRDCSTNFIVTTPNPSFPKRHVQVDNVTAHEDMNLPITIIDSRDQLVSCTGFEAAKPDFKHRLYTGIAVLPSGIMDSFDLNFTS